MRDFPEAIQHEPATPKGPDTAMLDARIANVEGQVRGNGFTNAQIVPHQEQMKGGMASVDTRTAGDMEESLEGLFAKAGV